MNSFDNILQNIDVHSAFIRKFTEQEVVLVLHKYSDAIGVIQNNKIYSNNPKVIIQLLNPNRNVTLLSKYNILVFLQNIGIRGNALFEISGKCNLRCVHCYTKNNSELSTINPDKFVELFYKLNVLSITLTGGEIILVPNRWYIISKLSDHFPLTILSNGTLWDDFDTDNLRSIPYIEVRLTLFSIRPNVHDNITGVPGSHYSVKCTIEKFLKLDIKFRVNLIILKKNEKYIEETVKWLDSKCISYVIDYMIFPCSRSVYQELASEVELRGLIKKKIIPPLEASFCTALYGKVMVNSRGDIFPCQFINYKIASINEDKDINSQIDESILKMKILGFNPNCNQPDCKICELYNKCFSCPGFNFLEFGSFYYKSKHLCNMNKHIHK